MEPDPSVPNRALSPTAVPYGSKLTVEEATIRTMQNNSLNA